MANETQKQKIARLVREAIQEGGIVLVFAGIHEFAKYFRKELTEGNVFEGTAQDKANWNLIHDLAGLVVNFKFSDSENAGD